jgi:hypothetical protein
MPTCRFFSTYLGPFGDAQMPQNSKKTNFLVAPDHFFLKNGPNDIVRDLFSSLEIVTYTLPTCKPLSTFLGPFGGAQIPQNIIKKLVLGCFILFFLQERAL